jgi:hypothetical protein
MIEGLNYFRSHESKWAEKESNGGIQNFKTNHRINSATKMKPFPEYKSDWYDKKKEFMQMNCSV